MSSGLCSSHMGSGTIKDDDTAETWRDLHPGTYKNLTLNTGQHPVECSRKQNLWEKPAAQRTQHSLTVSHQPPGCLPYPDAISVSVSFRATSCSSHTTVLGTETKACWWLAFQAPSCLVTVVGAEGALSGYGKGQTCEPNPWLCKVGFREGLCLSNYPLTGNSIIRYK